MSLGSVLLWQFAGLQVPQYSFLRRHRAATSVVRQGASLATNDSMPDRSGY
ncbi:hypothetical protein PspLS_06620 [Pyricularia sp. CBS 133598]|nr:hypothetical protein PspLS_06620 [Pyricularia sp. CBS 133598]